MLRPARASTRHCLSRQPTPRGKLLKSRVSKINNRSHNAEVVSSSLTLATKIKHSHESFFCSLSLATPNGVKVTVMLEELLALGRAGAVPIAADVANGLGTLDFDTKTQDKVAAAG